MHRHNTVSNMRRVIRIRCYCSYISYRPKVYQVLQRICLTNLPILTVLGLTDPDTSMVRKQSVRGTSRGLVKLKVASPSWPTRTSEN